MVNPNQNIFTKYKEMYLINSYRNAAVVPVYVNNTFIGGVASTINTPALLATALNIPLANIFNFIVIGNNIECYISESWVGSNQSIFQNNANLTYATLGNMTSTYNQFLKGNTNLKYVNFFDLTTFSGNSYIGMGGNTNLRRFIAPNYISNGGTNFFWLDGNTNMEILYIPKMTNIGNTAVSSGMFNNTSVPNLKIYANPFLQTSNGGAEEGDIAYARTKGATIVYVLNKTAPNSITNLSIGNIYGTALQLNFTAPSSTNSINFYEVYLNGIYYQTINASGDYITRLSLNTSYDIEVKPTDIYYNQSTSNIVTQATDATLVYQDYLVSYYKMQNNVLDSLGTNHGTATAIAYEAGLVGQRAVFNGTTSFVEVPDANNLSFGNGSVDTPFSSVSLMKFNSTTDQWVFNKRSKTVSTNDMEYQLVYYSGKLIILFIDQSTGGNITKEYVFTPTIGVNYIITVTYRGNSLHTGINLYVNTTSVGTSSLTGTYVAMENLTAPLTIGKAAWSSGFYLNAGLCELAFLNKELTAGEVSDINSKLNSGQSLI